VSKRPEAVTHAELAVLKVLWRSGPRTARALTEAIYPGGAESEFASVHSFLQRLERKGLVTRDRRAAPHIFSAAVSQADVVGRELTALADRLGEGSIAPLIMQLVAQKRLTKKEADEIRRVLDQYAK
jgi:BlaI family penicillinase repressor